MWILITIGIIALLFVLAMFFLRKRMAAMRPMDKGMAFGGIAGMLIGIALVEFWGFDYPVPFILWMLGMAGGQLAGWLLSKKK